MITATCFWTATRGRPTCNVWHFRC